MSRRGRTGYWVGPARDVLRSAGEPLHSNQIRSGICERGIEGASELAGTTLYTSMLQSRDFVRVAGRPSVFGLSAWYGPAAVLSRLADFLRDSSRDGDFARYGVPRDTDVPAVGPTLDCGELQEVMGAVRTATGTSAEAESLLDEDSVAGLRALLEEVAVRCPDCRADSEAVARWLVSDDIATVAEPPVEAVPEGLAVTEEQWAGLRTALRDDFLADAQDMLSGPQDELAAAVARVKDSTQDEIAAAKLEIAEIKRQTVDEVERMHNEMRSEFKVNLLLLPGRIRTQLITFILLGVLLGVAVSVIASFTYDSWKQNVIRAEVEAAQGANK